MIVLIKSNIIGKWYDVIRLTLKLILLDLKLRKKSLVLTYSSMLIVKANTKLIAIIVHFRSTDSTEGGIQRNLKSSLNSLNHG